MVFDFPTLEQGWKNVVAQNSEEINRARFKYNLVFNIFKILEEFSNNVFEPSPLRKKNVLYPKMREVQVPSIRDKMVQNVICDSYLNSKLSKPLIKETGACIKNRGTNYSSRILKEQLHNYFTKFGHHFYVLKCDIKSYFATIEHERIYRLIDRYVDDKQIAHIVKKFVNLMEIGLALGLPQSQLLANLNLSELDHKCKEELKAKYYGRYMDDFYIISNDIDYLKTCYEYINKYVNSIGLKLNPKTKIYKDNFDFIGFNYRLTDTGKVLKIVSKDKKYSKIRHIKKMLKELKCGKITKEKISSSYQGWRIHALNGNNYDLVMRIDAFIQNELINMGYIMKIKKAKKKERIIIECLEL